MFYANSITGNIVTLQCNKITFNYKQLWDKITFTWKLIPLNSQGQLSGDF